MLKEEKELRDYLRGRVLADPENDRYTLKDPMKLITALVRAVREDCAKVLDDAAEKAATVPAHHEDCMCDECIKGQQRAEVFMELAATIRGRR